MAPVLAFALVTPESAAASTSTHASDVIVKFVTAEVPCSGATWTAPPEKGECVNARSPGATAPVRADDELGMPPAETPTTGDDAPPPTLRKNIALDASPAKSHTIVARVGAKKYAAPGRSRFAATIRGADGGAVTVKVCGDAAVAPVTSQDTADVAPNGDSVTLIESDKIALAPRAAAMSATPAADWSARAASRFAHDATVSALALSVTRATQDVPVQSAFAAPDQPAAMALAPAATHNVDVTASGAVESITRAHGGAIDGDGSDGIMSATAPPPTASVAIAADSTAGVRPIADAATEKGPAFAPPANAFVATGAAATRVAADASPDELAIKSLTRAAPVNRGTKKRSSNRATAAGVSASGAAGDGVGAGVVDGDEDGVGDELVDVVRVGETEGVCDGVAGGVPLSEAVEDPVGVTGGELDGVASGVRVGVSGGVELALNVDDGVDGGVDEGETDVVLDGVVEGV